jgi:hypothetical protein
MSLMDRFKGFRIKETDPIKKKHLEVIKAQTLLITKKVITNKLTNKDIDKYESLIKKYHDKYPDKDKEEERKKKIAKLRQITFN